MSDSIRLSDCANAGCWAVAGNVRVCHYPGAFTKGKDPREETKGVLGQ
jgi:hypothetical protein